MNTRLACFGLALLLAVQSAGADPAGWGRLHPGLDEAAVLAALGPPLVRTAGRGFTTFVYDRGGEVLLRRGVVVAWTKPSRL